MSTTTLPFDALTAYDFAVSAAEMRLGQVQDELDAEYETALELARQYADHLAAGGDPPDYPKTTNAADRDRDQHGLARVAREAVFDAWNESRDRRSVTYPWGPGMPYRWLVHEQLLNRLGEPIPLGQLAALAPFKASPKTVADAVWSLQVATRGAVRVRKVRMDGKVCWLARLPVDTDNLLDLPWREGVCHSTLPRMSDEDIADALRRPFKNFVHEYPTEAR